MPNRDAGLEENCVRLFIGVRPDGHTQHFLDGLVGHAKHLLGGGKRDSARWTSHSNRHLTLAFLGETPSHLVVSIEEKLIGIAQNTAACQGRIAALQPFPKRRSRLLAAELLTNPELDRLHEHCRQLMRELGMKPESASYRPHVTLGRNPRGFSRLEPQAIDFIMNIDNLVLYESRLAPGGSQYHPLLEISLTPHTTAAR